ncbi:MAG: dihydropteroate synthase, partial [Actinomycetes bacterium]
GNVKSAKEAFAEFDSAWNWIEVYISTRSMEMYDMLERQMQAKLTAGLSDATPNTPGLLDQAKAMLAKFDEAVAMVETGQPLNPGYDDVVSEVHEAVLAMAHGARAAGVEEVFVDPGIGFGKTVEQNLKLLAHLPELVSQAHKEGFKVTVGTSRKRFLSELSPRFSPIPPEGRLPGTLATASWLALCGVDLIRVHDVIHTVRAVSLASHAQERGTSW